MIWLLAALTMILLRGHKFVRIKGKKDDFFEANRRPRSAKYGAFSTVMYHSNQTNVGDSNSRLLSALRRRRLGGEKGDEERRDEKHQKMKKRCDELVPSGATVDFYISRKKMRTIYEAVKLNIWALNFVVGPIDKRQKELEERYERFQGFTNTLDTAIVAKSEGVCHVAFGPGVLIRDCKYLLECFLISSKRLYFPNFVKKTYLNYVIHYCSVIQNLNPINEDIENSDCRVRKSYKDIYFNSYHDELKKEIRQCVRSCRHKGEGDLCPLVVSGFSQGGGVAYVAAIDLRKYNPVTVTFGATQGIISAGKRGKPCKDFDAEKHYRFMTTHPNIYDLIPAQANIVGGRHAGHLLYLDEDEKYLGYPGFSPPEIRIPSLFSLHFPNKYAYRIQQLVKTNCRIAAVKWQPGHWCNYDDECASGTCQKRKVKGSCA